MPILNYTTSIKTGKTAAEILEAIRRAGRITPPESHRRAANKRSAMRALADYRAYVIEERNSG